MSISTRIGLGTAAVLCAAAASNAAIFVYQTNLSGPQEAPPNASPGTGSATLTWDDVANTMELNFTFTGLTGNTTACHIHGPTAVPGAGTAGVMTTTPSFPSFPNGVTSGSYSRIFDLTLASSFNPSFVSANGGSVANARGAMKAAIDGGRAYLNLHTSTFGGGEIRGFFALVPTPGTGAMLGLAGLVAMRRRR